MTRRIADCGKRRAEACVIPIPHFTFKGSLVDLQLSASDEHLLSLRVPRAGRRPGYPPFPIRTTS